MFAIITCVACSQHDPEALAEYVVVLDSLMCVGTQEYMQIKAVSHKEPAVLSEPAAANMLISANISAAGAPLHVAKNTFNFWIITDTLPDAILHYIVMLHNECDYLSCAWCSTLHSLTSLSSLAVMYMMV
jgi:hypothetical protein